MKALLYLIGIPGSGKSALAQELVSGMHRRVYKDPFVHTVYENGLVQLGRERLTSSGTDTLSMSVQPSVIAALETGVWERVLGEGDRLANVGFFRAVVAAGYSTNIVLLDTPPDVAAERCAARGSSQNESWWKGRVTKVQRLRQEASLALDGTRPLWELADLLRNHEVGAEVLRGRPGPLNLTQ